MLLRSEDLGLNVLQQGGRHGKARVLSHQTPIDIWPGPCRLDGSGVPFVQLGPVDMWTP
jgi:hypothetical protein